MKIGIAVDHGGYVLKEDLEDELAKHGHDVVDFGAYYLGQEDDFPDFVVPMAQAVADGSVERGIAVCGSGVGACIAANKVPGVRAALVSDVYTARQGVQDDHMNVLCLGGRVIGPALAWELIDAFVNAQFGQEKRFLRRLEKLGGLEAAVAKGTPHGH